MSRTPIPDRLIHRREEVERNARHFDQLCRLAEEIALPVVGEALVRETTATAAEALTSEAKLALEGLVNDAALRDFEEPGVLDEVRKSLEGPVPPPDEEERNALARDVAQVLMGTWVEMLRGEFSTNPSQVLPLSDQLLPFDANRFFWGLLTNAPQPLSEALGSLGFNEQDTSGMMTKLRAKLFSEPRLVQLPFELVMAGAPQGPVLAMTQSTCNDLVEAVHARAPVRPPSWRKKWVPVAPSSTVPGFITPAAQVAVANLSANLSLDLYASVTQRAGRANAYLCRMAEWF